jgi:hypothetical protein
MFRIFMAALLIAAFASAGPATAGKDKYKWKADGCKYEYKANAKGFQEKYKCK